MNQLCEFAFHSLISQLPNQEQNALSGFPFHLKDSSWNQYIQMAQKLVMGNENLTNILILISARYSLKIQILDKEVGKSYSYPLQVVNASTIFPNDKKEGNKKALFKAFMEAVNRIPKTHQKNPELWLDHFDTACQIYLGNMPSDYAKDISFYDYHKSVTALATALYAWEKSLDKVENNEFCLIQGDFFGIQDFIFSGGSETNKKAAKLLRGRSFQVSLFTELAALRVLQACGLPSTSQIMNAAGKFLIIAPNTQAVKTAIENVKKELNDWFVKHTYGLIGLGIATKSASQNDFMGDNFGKLRDSLFAELETIKLQRLDLLDTENPTESVLNVDYGNKVCRFNSYFPANENDESDLSADQITIGEHLVKKDRILICDENAHIAENEDSTVLKMIIFGYKVVFTRKEELSGQFGKVKPFRFWDFELPEKVDEAIWHGYARRYINGYVPHKGQEIIPFDELAELHRIENDKGEKQGQIALMTLKGDVDNLGTIFQKGFEKPNLAKMAALSRQMNQFFSLWLPAVCAEKFQQMYTVFAGGDDFFLIGPWKQTQELAYEMQQAFAKYVAENKGIHFSAGMVMTKLGMPVPQMGELAEEALEQAKDVDGKNAVTIYQQSVSWHTWQSLQQAKDEIERLAENYAISTAYLYSLIYFAGQAGDTQNIENTMWRSRFYYKTARYVVDKLAKEKRQKALDEISISLGKGIEQHKNAFKIPLFNYFYQIRK
ncbi:CRISPR-associated protein Csm1 [Bibersteinia trehalosi Y31]|uniref:CRISPR system single-strand-specific deoxyribonuclease Cas10/Csm1 (subtype III-A) n=1 Tax=Bibersteinia trehalosi Y31 TaxID=1261658 RepID=A0A179CZU1_BIBTR|nr:type III-A CRISPR-associated protein Cas10/Csm1 [Bibersteinia trehalosi]OAQ15413.1 CRISPR-associated protein Csm1 [Bibersteinia trehalosi Y31]